MLTTAVLLRAVNHLDAVGLAAVRLARPGVKGGVRRCYLLLRLFQLGFLVVIGARELHHLVGVELDGGRLIGLAISLNLLFAGCHACHGAIRLNI